MATTLSNNVVLKKVFIGCFLAYVFATNILMVSKSKAVHDYQNQQHRHHEHLVEVLNTLTKTTTTNATTPTVTAVSSSSQSQQKQRNRIIDANNEKTSDAVAITEKEDVPSGDVLSTTNSSSNTKTTTKGSIQQQQQRKERDIETVGSAAEDAATPATDKEKGEGNNSSKNADEEEEEKERIRLTHGIVQKVNTTTGGHHEVFLKPNNNGTQQQQIVDWSKYDHVYYYHTRKAGGTALGRWIKKIAKKHRLSFSIDEGTTFEQSLFVNYSNVFYVTSMRQPISRVLSSYSYDYGKQNNMSISEFVTKTEKQNRRKAKIYDRSIGRKRGWVWGCSSDCYSKWFGSWPTPNKIPDPIKAAEILNKFEILWLEDLKNPAYVDWLFRRYDAGGCKLFHKRPSHNNKPTYNDSDIALLESVNKKDALLYSILRKKWTRISPHISMNITNITTATTINGTRLVSQG